MGRLTLAVRLKPEANRDGEHVIRIRITKDRAVTFWALNMALPAVHFNEKGTKQLCNWIRKSYRDYKLYNERIYEAYLKAEAAGDFFEKRDLDYTSADVRNYLEQGGYPDKLLPFYVNHIKTRRQQAAGDLSKIQTAEAYESSLRVLRWYLRETYSVADSVSDEELDQRYWSLGKLSKKDILSIKAWMESSYAENTVTSYLRNLRHVLYQAAEAGLVSYERFPMRGVSLSIKRKKVNRLQDEDIELLASEPAPKKHRGGHPSVTDPGHARALAMSMYLVHGARLSDALTWRVENYTIEGEQHRLRYTTGKNKKSMSVLLDQEAISILSPYLTASDGQAKPGKAFLFPYLPADFDQLPAPDQFIQLRRAKIRARQQIIRLGERIGLKQHLTPHVMRHSFADMMRRSGVLLETRQEVLGHSDIKTTRNYEEQFDQTAVDEVSLLYQKRKRKS